MNTIESTPKVQKTLEDALAYLPCSTVYQYSKGSTIYDQRKLSTSIYLVINGRVRVSRITRDSNRVLMDIYQCDEIFGEEAMLGPSRRPEVSVAVEDTKVMAWTTSQIEEITGRRPQLAIALLQMVVGRSEYFKQRIQSLSMDNVSQRLTQALLYFSKRAGHEAKDGSVQMMHFSHELLADYIGTTREAVTLHLNRFRREGQLLYSRKGITLQKNFFRDDLPTSCLPPVPLAA